MAKKDRQEIFVSAEHIDLVWENQKVIILVDGNTRIYLLAYPTTGTFDSLKQAEIFSLYMLSTTSTQQVSSTVFRPFPWLSISIVALWRAAL